MGPPTVLFDTATQIFSAENREPHIFRFYFGQITQNFFKTFKAPLQANWALRMVGLEPSLARL